MARVWERREAGESCVDISFWLSRIGYLIRPDEVAIIASQYAQRRETVTTRRDRGNDRQP